MPINFAKYNSTKIMRIKTKEQRVWNYPDISQFRGVSLVADVADVVMAWWTGEFKKLARMATIDFMTEFLIDSGLC